MTPLMLVQVTYIYTYICSCVYMCIYSSLKVFCLLQCCKQLIFLYNLPICLKIRLFLQLIVENICIPGSSEDSTSKMRDSFPEVRIFKGQIFLLIGYSDSSSLSGRLYIFKFSVQKIYIDRIIMATMKIIIAITASPRMG